MNRVVVDRVPPVGARVTVDAPGSHHLLHVQRVARGARVEVVDARGGRGRGRLVEGTPLAVIEVDEVLPAAAPPERVLLLGIPRGPALDDALTAAVEAGATRVILVRARRTPPGAVRADRLDRLVRAAMTQCGSSVPPPIEGPLPLGAALALPLPPRRLLASPGGPPQEATAEAAVVAIGPEGGWAPEEVEALVASHFAPLGLGPWVLRTPTAVVAALARLWPGP